MALIQQQFMKDSTEDVSTEFPLLARSAGTGRSSKAGRFRFAYSTGYRTMMYKSGDTVSTKERGTESASAYPSLGFPLQLMKLPLEERRKVLAKAIAEAEDDYLSDPELTDFEAFGDNDLYDETP